MTPDNITFDLTHNSCLSIRKDGQVSMLIGNDWYDLTDTNFGRFLMERRRAIALTPRPEAERCLTNTIQ